MELSKIVTALNVYCHPNLAESWDNVGLLIEPTPPHKVETIVITNDLSDQVVDEAVNSKSGLIFSYHPPIFVPFKRMTQVNWKKRNIIKCIENRIGIYSPHTCLDGKEDGLNDFLLSPFELSSKVSVTPPGFMNDDVYEATASYNENFKRFSLAMPIAPTAVDINSASGRIAKFKFPKSQKDNIHQMLEKHNVVLLSEEVITRPQPMGQGSGRVGMLKEKTTIKHVVDAYKTLLGTNQIKVAFGKRKTLSDEATCIAVCAGSGGKLLTCQAPALLADVLVTGEASHQEQLEAISRGATMIIIGHATVERKYLSAKVLPWMKSELTGVNIIFAESDKDPVEIV